MEFAIRISTNPVEVLRTTKSTPLDARSILCVTHPAEFRTTSELETKLPSIWELDPSGSLQISPFPTSISSNFPTFFLSSLKYFYQFILSVTKNQALA